MSDEPSGSKPQPNDARDVMRVTPGGTPPSPMASPSLSDAARDYVARSSAPNTARAYTAALADFTDWCAAQGLAALPAAPQTVGSFLAARATTHKVASLQLRLVAIGQAHRLAGHRLDTGHPSIRETLKGIRRTHGTAATKKEAAVSAVLRDALDRLAALPGPRPLRDRALLLVGFAAALRRSELVALDVADLRFAPEGVVLILRRSKTDADGQGAEIAIPHGTSDRTCPIRALRAWLDVAGIVEGAVFRAIHRCGRVLPSRLSDRDVARVVKAAVGRAGYDEAAFAGHSLRAGFITSAARAGVAERHIQNQSRHRSLPVLRGYIRRGSLFIDNAAAKVGL